MVPLEHFLLLPKALSKKIANDDYLFPSLLRQIDEVVVRGGILNV